jgi:hypothetical protein
MSRLSSLCLLSVFLSPTTFAAWIHYGSTYNSTNFFDPSLTKKNGNIRDVIELENFKAGAFTSEGKGYHFKSSIKLLKVDCTNNRELVVSKKIYNELGGEGLMLAEFSKDYKLEGDQIEEGSISEVLKKFVCR